MKSLVHLMVAGLIAAPMALTAPIAPAQAHTQEARIAGDRVLEGDWGGPIGNGHVTFRFQYEEGAWRGFFVSGRDGSLYPVEELQVSGRSVSFRHKSNPELRFSLAVEDDNRTLSGTATLPDGSASIYSLTRK